MLSLTWQGASKGPSQTAAEIIRRPLQPLLWHGAQSHGRSTYRPLPISLLTLNSAPHGHPTAYLLTLGQAGSSFNPLSKCNCAKRRRHRISRLWCRVMCSARMRQRRSPISQKKVETGELKVDAREQKFCSLPLFPCLHMDFPGGVFVRHATLVEIASQRFPTNLNSDCWGLI